jgi:hypothetical protein
MLSSVVACSDNSTAPKSTHAPIGAPSLDIIVNRIAEDSTSADFTVTPSGGTFVLGPHAIHFPANSICDPETSTYGVSEWDAPCTAATGNIDIHAEVRNVNGVSTIDFTPALRFVPTENSMDYVWLLMKSEEARTGDVRAFAIFWASHMGGDLVNEATADSTMKTYVWQSGGVAFRRIKHFSQYVIRDGLDVEDVASNLVSFTDISPIEF